MNSMDGRHQGPVGEKRQKMLGQETLSQKMFRQKATGQKAPGQETPEQEAAKLETLERKTPGQESPGQKAHERETPEQKAPGQELLEEAAKNRSELDPYEINFLPEFTEGRGPREPFVNDYGVVIGDHMYQSPNSPLEQWDENTDPAVMSGDQWVHPFKDIGFLTEENRQFFEKGIPPQGGIFMHPNQDAAYRANLEHAGGGLFRGKEHLPAGSGRMFRPRNQEQDLRSGQEQVRPDDPKA